MTVEVPDSKNGDVPQSTDESTKMIDYGSYWWKAEW